MEVDVLQALINAADLSVSFLCKTLPFMVIGVIFAEFIVAMKFTDKIAFIAKPITNFAHLSSECGASFVTAFVSPASANSMLAAFYSDGRIEKKELFVASMLNTFPATVMHWRSTLPIPIPLLGVAGAIYFSILTLVGLIKTLLIMLVGRILLVKKHAFSIPNDPKDSKKPNTIDALKTSLKNSKKTIKRILIATVPTTFIVFALYTLGAFTILACYLSCVSRLFPIPPEGLTIIAAYFGSRIAAATVAGNLLSAGTLTGKEVVITLLVGNVLSTFLTMPRHEAPYYIGIFGPKNGMQIMLLSTTIRAGIMLGIIFALAWW